MNSTEYHSLLVEALRAHPDLNPVEAAHAYADAIRGERPDDAEVLASHVHPRDLPDPLEALVAELAEKDAELAEKEAEVKRLKTQVIVAKSKLTIARADARKEVQRRAAEASKRTKTKANHKPALPSLQRLLDKRKK